MQLLAAELAKRSVPTPPLFIEDVEIPDNATPEVEEYRTWHRQDVCAAPRDWTPR